MGLFLGSLFYSIDLQGTLTLVQKQFSDKSQKFYAKNIVLYACDIFPGENILTFWSVFFHFPINYREIYSMHITVLGIGVTQSIKYDTWS